MSERLPDFRRRSSERSLLMIRRREGLYYKFPGILQKNEQVMRSFSSVRLFPKNNSLPQHPKGLRQTVAAKMAKWMAGAAEDGRNQSSQVSRHSVLDGRSRRK